MVYMSDARQSALPFAKENLDHSLPVSRVATYSCFGLELQLLQTVRT
jgi:hypothetical protein